MGDFCAEGSIVHEKDVEVLGVVDQELLEPVGEVVPGFLVGAVADLGHRPVTSESAPHPVVDACLISPSTVGSSPAGGQSPCIQVRLEPGEVFRSLLHDPLAQEGCGFDH